MRLGRHLVSGVVAGAVGTAAIDLELYRRYRRDGGKDPLWRWEFASGVISWDEASAPGQFGRKVLRLVTRREPPDDWARLTTNFVHWATGIGWGIQYGALAGRTSATPGCGRSPSALRSGCPATWCCRWPRCTSRSGGTTPARSATTCPPTWSTARQQAPPSLCSHAAVTLRTGHSRRAPPQAARRCQI